MPVGITTTVGHAPIPFAGFAGMGRYGRSRSRTSFSGSSELVAIAHEALGRLQNAIDTANEACSRRDSDWLSGFSTIRWLAGDTSTESICNAAYNMQAAYDTYRAKVDDPNTSDDQIAEIIGYVNKNIDIHDLVDLADSTAALTVTGRALLRAPGTAVGWVAEGTEQIVGGIVGAIPWWVYVGGAVALAVMMGWTPLRKAS